MSKIMILVLVVSAALGTKVNAIAQPIASCHPHYEGAFNAHFNDDGRTLTLLNKYTFVDGDCSIWSVPEKAIVDGATIPPILWSAVGGPLEDKYRNASVIHDWFCDKRTRPWQDVHRMFFHAMLATGVSPIRAKLMYFAVYAGGPKWSEVTVRNNRLNVSVGSCPACLSNDGATMKDLEKLAAIKQKDSQSAVVDTHEVVLIPAPTIQANDVLKTIQLIKSGDLADLAQIEAHVEKNMPRAITNNCPDGAVFSQASGACERNTF